MKFENIKFLIFVIAAVFFLYFGISTMEGAYHTKNAFIFIIYFFSSSLMILVSIAIISSAIFRIFKKNSGRKDEDI